MRKRVSILALVVMSLGAPGSRSVLAATPAANEDDGRQIFYTLSSNPVTTASELWAIEVNGSTVSTTDIGPSGFCASLAISPSGTLLSMCGPLFGTEQLASLDPRTGHATIFGVPVSGLAVMSMTFGPDGTLYAVGDCNPGGAAFDCGGGPPDPNYNSLYTVNEVTGTFTRVGSTGAPEYFMDLTFDREGNMLGVTTTLLPSYVPAVLYRINVHTGAATKITDLVGSNTLMGLGLGRNGKLYANDFVLNPGLYLVDPKTGLETAIASLPMVLPSSVKLAPVP
jgi:hypothetical protein